LKDLRAEDRSQLPEDRKTADRGQQTADGELKSGPPSAVCGQIKGIWRTEKRRKARRSA